MCPTSTPHLSAFCEIRATDDGRKGRGVFARQHIPALTTVDISPVLLFSNDEYEQHARHTAADHYTFKWRDGRTALALRPGSAFNHSSTPNVSYMLDSEHACIRYTTMRSVAPAEELCICYGTKLWFEDRSGHAALAEDGEEEDLWTPLASVQLADPAEDPDELVPERELPFERVATTRTDDDSEDEGEVQTIDAWVVDIPDPRQTADMIDWLKQSTLAHPALKHAKLVRRRTDASTPSTPPLPAQHRAEPAPAPRTTLLLTPASAPAPAVPGGLAPYVAPVPRHPARTRAQVALKGAVWPVAYEARERPARQWTRATVRWFRAAAGVVGREAQRARLRGEVPIAAYVPAPLGAVGARGFVAHDTRVSARHPLRHAVFNVVRLVGDAADGGGAQNGQNYLLTGRTLFTSHEPCIACSMALLHSRVKEVVYLHAMPKTGGCGGAACVPGLEGVNHRFEVWKWRGLLGGGGVQDDVDA